MDLTDELDLRTRTINKFYARIRTHLDDLVLLEPERSRPVSESLKNIKEEQKYGLVKERELDLILKAHEKQPNKPVKCDQLEANSLSKLLFSKPGFHNASSTAYLIEDLRINDINRNSFLGGHSTYSVKKENTLDYIRRSQQGMWVGKRAKEILAEMDRTGLDDVREIDVQDLAKQDHEHGDTLAVQGRYNVLRRRFDAAVNQLEQALNNKTNHAELVKKNLSVALFEIGCDLYTRRDFQKAFKYFEDALGYDPSHQSARKHLELCNSQMIAYQARPFGYHDSRRNFNQRRK